MASTTPGDACVSIGWSMGDGDICLSFLLPPLSTPGVRPVCSSELKVIDHGVMADVEPEESVFSVPLLASVPLLLVSVPILKSCCSKGGGGSDPEFLANSKLTRPAA